jgi:hypothetical protein
MKSVTLAAHHSHRIRTINHYFFGFRPELSALKPSEKFEYRARPFAGRVTHRSKYIKMSHQNISLLNSTSDPLFSILM